MDLALVSTAHLEVIATRTEALRILYRNVDITTDEYFQGKKALRSVLEKVAGTRVNPIKVEFIETEDVNGNQ